MAGRERTRSRDINYLSKDFDSIKADLIDYLKRYFPNEIRDFNDVSGGMAILELMAYMGDILSFNIDKNINEVFTKRAIERKNIVANAEEKGYNVKTVTPSTVLLNVSATFDATISATTICKVRKGSRVVSAEEPANFEITQDVDFAKPQNRQHSRVGNNVTYTVTGVEAAAGRSKVFKYTVTTPKKFLKITLPDRGVTEVESITGSDGNEWFEVDNLARDTVFAGVENTSSNSADVGYIMKLKQVPRRFVLEREADGLLTARFGAGVLLQEDSDVIPNPEDYVLPPTLRGSPSGFVPAAIDSTNFLKTKTLGTVPRNVVLDINYRVGGGLDTNVGADVLTRFVEKRVEFSNPNLTAISSDTTNTIIASITCNNPEAATGGEDAEINESIRENSILFFSSQARCVTLQDYQARVLAMPPQFGTVFRSYARKDPANKLGIELAVVSRNNTGSLTASSGIIKNNIETYIKQFRSISDTVKIIDGKIVNIGVNFTIVPAPDVNDQEALIKAILTLQEMFDVRLTNFNTTYSKSEIIAKLQSLPEIRSIPLLNITNITGDIEDRTYSNVGFNINTNTRSGITTFPDIFIPEVKYPDFDIQGTIAT